MEKKPFYKRWWFIALIALIIIGAFFSGDEETEVTDNDTEIVQNTTEVESEEATEEIKLTQDMLEEVESFIEEETLVTEANVGLYEDDTQIRIAIHVNNATNEEHAEELADSAVRYLSSVASANN